jgi:6-phosphogluconolactonase
VSAPPRVIVGTRTALADAFVNRLVDLSRDAGRFSIALSGGSAADAFCPALARAPLDWRRIDLFWCDERSVPPDHPDSNYRIASELLLDRIDIDPARVHRMHGEAHDLDRAAAEYEREMRSVLGSPPRLDAALVGVGPDGHICSLFPGHRALTETSRYVIAVDDSPKPPPRRLTLTLPALAGTHLVVGAFGLSKAGAIAEALNPHSSLPVALAIRSAREALLLLDDEAASRSSSL